MRIFFCGTLILALACPTLIRAADHSVEVLVEAAPADALAPDIATQLSPQGIRVLRGTRTVCDIWVCKQWPVKSLEATGDVLYPLTPGQLIGVVRYARKGSDFRDQDIAEGVYTLRYGQQPVDGAHVGSSLTRDFLLLVQAAEDTSGEVLAYKPLAQLSAKAAGTTHPCLLSLQRAEGEEPIREVSERDWWIVRLSGQLVKDDQTRTLPVDLVIVGQAE
jgi:hypothetical protein